MHLIQMFESTQLSWYSQNMFSKNVCVFLGNQFWVERTQRQQYVFHESAIFVNDSPTRATYTNHWLSKEIEDHFTISMNS